MTRRTEPDTGRAEREQTGSGCCGTEAAVLMVESEAELLSEDQCWAQ